MSHENIKVALYQFDVLWEDPSSNKAKIERWLKKTDQNIDIVFLPEMFTTGFTINAESLAEKMDGETIQWLKEISAEYQFAICGSLIITENNEFFNRFVFVEPTGEIHFYNKRHLFTMSGENTHYQKGEERVIITYNGWRICPLICYDLRFPVWSRNKNDYDLLVYTANWPSNRQEIWNTLLKARAIENQAYVIGVNRIGIDGNSISHAGNSQVIDPKGTVIASTEDYFGEIISGELSFSELIKFRESFQVLDDADKFQITDN